MRYWLIIGVVFIALFGVTAIGTNVISGNSSPDVSPSPTSALEATPSPIPSDKDEIQEHTVQEAVQSPEPVIPYTPSAATCSGCVAVSTVTVSEGTPQAVQPAVDDIESVISDDAEEVVEEEPDVNCSKPVRKDRFASAYNDSLGRGKLWRLRVRKDEMGVLNFFSQWKAPNLWSKIKIRPGYNRLIKGGGDIVIYPAACMNSRTVKKAMKNRSSDQKVLPRIPAKYIAKSKQDRFGQVR